MELELHQIQKKTEENENKRQTDNAILPRKKSVRHKQFDLFKKKGGMHIIRKFVPGTEEDAKKWQSPKDWADWSLKRVEENGYKDYKIWVLFFFCCWMKEMECNKTSPDQSLTFRVQKSDFWKEMVYFPHLKLKITDISIHRRTLYNIRQINGFPEYRGRMELISKWKNI